MTDADAPRVALERGALLQLMVGLGVLAIRAATSDEQTLELRVRADAETGGARIDIQGLDLAQERERPAHRANVEALEALIQRAGGAVHGAPAGQTRIDLPKPTGTAGQDMPVFPSE